MLIRMGNWLERAREVIGKTMQRDTSGLYVPAHMAGQHYGGFNGYTPWVQDCIRKACEVCRHVGPDELAEMTAIVAWIKSDISPEPDLHIFAVKHSEACEILEKTCNRIADMTKAEEGMSKRAGEQLRAVQTTRAAGTLVVCALNLTEYEKTGKLMLSLSTWSPASMEEALAVPKRTYMLG